MASNEARVWTGEEEEDGGSDSDSDLGSPSVYVLQPRALKRSNEENPSSESNKKPKNAKLWSDEDEVALVNGIISYQDSTGRRFNADLKAFYKFVKGKLQAQFSKGQITAKIRRLKKRFFNVSMKSPVFSNPHDAYMFSIYEKIWAGPAAPLVAIANGNLQIELNENDKDSVDDKGKNVEKQAEDVELDEKQEDELEDEESEDHEKEEEKEEGELEEEKEKEKEVGKVDFHSKYPFLSASFSYPCMILPQSGFDLDFVLASLSSIGDSKLKELDDKWKQLTVEEVGLSVKKQTLMIEQIKMTL